MKQKKVKENSKKDIKESSEQNIELEKRNKIYEALFKRACGYEAIDTVEEVVLDKDGIEKSFKTKTTKYQIAPDMTAIKILLDINKESDTSELTEEELVKERDRLIGLLLATK